ncbi:MAG: translation initiation factor eIF-2B [Candidatus Dojkabacteria bacterium]
MQRYPEIEKIYEDIKKLNIQGATNVCLATFEGMKMYLQVTKETEKAKLFEEFFSIGDRLARVRENEPLAVNGVTFLRYFFNKKFSDLPELSSMKRELNELCDEYLKIISSSKKELITKSEKALEKFSKVLTHCHSSTAVSLIKSIAQGDKDFEAICTETRPLFQGRITAKSLLEGGIKTTMIADSAVESFIIGRGSSPVEVIFLGCDEILGDGSAINKIGSWGIGMASHYVKKPLYVVTPSLKLDCNGMVDNNKIEVREDKELWSDAPKGLDIFNPAFEIIDKELITGYITELGIIEPKDIVDSVTNKYPWIVNKI